MDAQARADQLAAEDQAKRRAAMQTWLTTAEREIRDLPSKISRDIADHTQPNAVREQLRQMVGQRLDRLRRMADVRITNIRPAAHVKVHAAGVPLEPTEKDSEAIAMRAVHYQLVSEGFAIADVHTEGRGYDLYGTRGQSQRCVEVKGVWDSAATSGIRLTGNEILTATQRRTDYWLYVVDQCSNGTGNVFGIYRDPVSTFEGLIKQEALFRVPGSALKPRVMERRPHDPHDRALVPLHRGK